MRLSNMFDLFMKYLEIERGARPKSLMTYHRAWKDFIEFVWKHVKLPPDVVHFNEEVCRAYQYNLVERQLAPATVRLRMSILASLGKWAVKRQRIKQNPIDTLTLPRRRTRKLPVVPRFEVVESWLADGLDPRLKAVLAVMAYGGLRRTEVVLLNVEDYDPQFGLRRVQGKGGTEGVVPLPAVARQHVDTYLAERPEAQPTDPLFLAKVYLIGRRVVFQRLSGQRLYMMVRTLGEHRGMPKLHPHALRHACGTKLMTGTKDILAVKDHLRHVNVQTTMIYTHLAQAELARIVEEGFCPARKVESQMPNPVAISGT